VNIAINPYNERHQSVDHGDELNDDNFSSVYVYVHVYNVFI